MKTTLRCIAILFLSFSFFSCDKERIAPRNAENGILYIKECFVGAGDSDSPELALSRLQAIKPYQGTILINETEEGLLNTTINCPFHYKNDKDNDFVLEIKDVPCSRNDDTIVIDGQGLTGSCLFNDDISEILDVSVVGEWDQKDNLVLTVTGMLQVRGFALRVDSVTQDKSEAPAEIIEEGIFDLLTYSELSFTNLAENDCIITITTRPFPENPLVINVPAGKTEWVKLYSDGEFWGDYCRSFDVAFSDGVTVNIPYGPSSKNCLCLLSSNRNWFFGVNQYVGDLFQRYYTQQFYTISHP